MNQAFIKYTEYYLPKKSLSNEELSIIFPDWDADKIYNKLGIKYRSIAADNEFASDLAVNAAELLFVNNSVEKSEIDYVIYCTQSPDYFLPTTACILQERLGLSIHCGAIDINQGCSGFIYGLGLAKGLIVAGIAKNILFLTAETYSKYLHPSDKSNRTIFGDAATATLISTEGMFEIGNMYFGTNGKGAKNLIVENGGTRNSNYRAPIEADLEKTDFNAKDFLFMNGPEIFNFTLETIPQILEKTLAKNNLKQEDIDFFIFHQANKYLLDNLQKKMKITKEKFYNNIENTGNTVSCTIPIALKNSIVNGVLKKNDTILLAGFGVGYSWSGCVITKA
jgi:3-oxoacyl-[acyl-carrier-protein] synthase-3